jgi:hypothetical protein
LISNLVISFIGVQPTATNGNYQYAVSFSYSIQCKITDILVNVDGQDTSEDTPVTLSGNVDGVMEAKQTPIEILNVAIAAASQASSSVPAIEAPSVEASDGPVVVNASTRSLLKRS